MTLDADRLALIEEFLADPVLCHSVLFEHRHPQRTPAFHEETIRAWWSRIPRLGEMSFRGAAKSTRAEDALAAMAGMGFYRYAVIVGNSEARAVERLSAIKHEISTNGRYIAAFGELQGPIWNEAEVLLANGVMLRAIGARQSLRGLKHWDQRPDMLFIDDLEDEENVTSRTPARSSSAGSGARCCRHASLMPRSGWRARPCIRRAPWSG